MDDEAYTVYSSILPNTSPLMLRATTTTFDLCLVPLDEQAESVLRPVLNDYTRANSKRWLLRPNLGEKRSATMLSGEEFQATFANGTSGAQARPGWKTFFARHPENRGWIEVSAVGFNSEKTIAVVYMGYRCGEHCAGGEFKALEKKNGKWQILTGRGRWNHCIWMHPGTST
jgi:hypothetical protein